MDDARAARSKGKAFLKLANLPRYYKFGGERHGARGRMNYAFVRARGKSEVEMRGDATEWRFGIISSSRFRIYIYIYRMLPIESYKFSRGGRRSCSNVRRHRLLPPCMLIFACKIFRQEIDITRVSCFQAILVQMDKLSFSDRFELSKPAKRADVYIDVNLHVLLTPRTILHNPYV